MKSVIYLLACFSMLISCNAQTKKEQAIISISDSVTHLPDTILSIYQDSRLNYWFGSRGHGAFKYDGKKLIQYEKKDGLLDQDIWGIQEDQQGRIYFDTQEGISQLDHGKFQSFRIADAPAGAWLLAANDLWFRGNFSKNGPLRFDGKNLYKMEFPFIGHGDKLYKEFPGMSYSPYGIYSIYRDKRGDMWFGTALVGLYRFDGTSLLRMYEDQLTNTGTGGSFGIRSIYEDHEGKFWICNTQHRYNILSGFDDIDGEKQLRYKAEVGIQNSKVDGDWIYYMSILEDNQNRFWMLTFNRGIWCYDGKNLKKYAIKKDEAEVTLYTLHKDRNGVIWVGTHTDGAYRFNGSSFEKFEP